MWCEFKGRCFNMEVCENKSHDSEPRPLYHSSWSLDICICYLSLNVEQIPSRKQLKGGRVYLAYSVRVQPIMAGEAWWHESQALTTASAVREQRAVDASAQSSLFFPKSRTSFTHGMVPSHLGWAFPPWLNWRDSPWQVHLGACLLGDSRSFQVDSQY